MTTSDRNKSIQAKTKNFRKSLSVDKAIEIKKQFEPKGKQQKQNKIKDEDVVI